MKGSFIPEQGELIFSNISVPLYRTKSAGHALTSHMNGLPLHVKWTGRKGIAVKASLHWDENAGMQNPSAILRELVHHLVDNTKWRSISGMKNAQLRWPIGKYFRYRISVGADSPEKLDFIQSNIRVEGPILHLRRTRNKKRLVIDTLGGREDTNLARRIVRALKKRWTTMQKSTADTAPAEQPRSQPTWADKVRGPRTTQPTTHHTISQEIAVWWTITGRDALTTLPSIWRGLTKRQRDKKLRDIRRQGLLPTLEKILGQDKKSESADKPQVFPFTAKEPISPYPFKLELTDGENILSTPTTKPKRKRRASSPPDPRLTRKAARTPKMTTPRGLPLTRETIATLFTPVTQPPTLRLSTPSPPGSPSQQDQERQSPRQAKHLLSPEEETNMSDEDTPLEGSPSVIPTSNEQ